MKILIVSATGFEIAPLLKFLEDKAYKRSFFEYDYKNVSLFPLVTGVGAMKTAFAISRFSEIKHVTLAINVGLAGALNSTYNLGDVLEVQADRFADLGVEEMDGSFTDVFDLGLEKSDSYPFKDGWLENYEPKYVTNLKKCKALTVNKVHGTTLSIALLKEKYKADLESMEGAGFMYGCKMMDVKFNQLRAVSNYVEPRNKDKWKIDLAIDNLNKELIEYLELLARQYTTY